MTTEITEAQKLVPQEWVDFIRKSPEKIKEELAKSDGDGKRPNSWLACFRTRTTGLKLKLDLGLRSKSVPKEIIDEIYQKLRIIMNREQELINREDWNPPEEVRQELLTDLQNLI